MEGKISNFLKSRFVKFADRGMSLSSSDSDPRDSFRGAITVVFGHSVQGDGRNHNTLTISTEHFSVTVSAHGLVDADREALAGIGRELISTFESRSERHTTESVWEQR